MSNCQNVKMSNCQKVKLSKRQTVKMSNCQNIEMHGALQEVKLQSPVKRFTSRQGTSNFYRSCRQRCKFLKKKC